MFIIPMADLTDMESTEQLVEKYFCYGFEYKDILSFLNNLHNKRISYRSLKRILSRLQLYRRKKYSKIEDVVKFLEEELNKSGKLHGYRWMHLRCLQNNLTVTQEVVRELLSCLDPVGSDLRRRKRLRRRQYHNKGPNFLWHVDSYDKLKPYGVCINGCIDGYSRHIIWLRCGSTSNDPKVIGGYYLDAVGSVGGIPKTVRFDLGTENKVIENLQNILHDTFNDVPTSKPAVLYGRSTSNQRIESWWSILRKHSAQFWMNIFQMLKGDNHYDGSFLDKSLIQYCFMDLIQRDLDEIVLEWSVHKIRKSRNSISPTGRPTIMYEMPSLYGTLSYLIAVPPFATDVVRPQCTFLNYPCDEDLYNLCNIIMAENGFKHESDPFKTIDLYIALRNILKNLTSE